MKPIDLLLILIILSGCNTNKPLGASTTVRERLVPVAMPTYFGSMKVFMGCDSNGNVIVHDMEQASSSGVDLSFKMDSNALEMTFKNKPDTIYVKAQDSIVEKSLVKIVPADLPWWKNSLMFLGVLFIFILIININKKN